MTTPVIKVQNVSKKYCRSLKMTMRYGMVDLGKSFFNLPRHTEQLRKEEFWAVRDVSFSVGPGECLGLIGPNGSGKTTVLKMLNGIFMPDRGSVEIDGRVGALLEVGAGFHPMLTGRENIYIHGSVIGMGKQEIDRKFNDIVAFSGIGSFIDSPVKHYSSGMYVRLGFSIAAHMEFSILVVDEILAVGDLSFQRKCLQTIKEMIANGRAVIMVSHNMDIIRSLCRKSIYLHEGNIAAMGETSHVLKAYLDDQLTVPTSVTSEAHISAQGKENNPVVLHSIEFLSSHEPSVGFLRFGAPVTVRFCYESVLPKTTVCFGFSLWTRNAIRITTVNSKLNGKTYDIVKGRGEVLCQIDRWPILPGNYLLKATVYDAATDWRYGGIGYDGNPMQPLIVTTGSNRHGKMVYEEWGLAYIDHLQWADDPSSSSSMAE